MAARFLSFSEAVSFIINCDNQEEVDYYWNNLSEGGEIQMCGWLKDKFGLSWQVVPTMVADLFIDHESANAQRAMQALMQMKKLDIAVLEKAYAG
jgi:predicted 3-demethylubiquinone-9 3-methyltransferase (glyoxalase superfamily)